MALCSRPQLWLIRHPLNQTLHLFLHGSSRSLVVQVRLNNDYQYPLITSRILISKYTPVLTPLANPSAPIHPPIPSFPIKQDFQLSHKLKQNQKPYILTSIILKKQQKTPIFFPYIPIPLLFYSILKKSSLNPIIQYITILANNKKMKPSKLKSKSKKKQDDDYNFQLSKYLPSKKHVVRQFYVDEDRKEIDDYMINSIKNNKKNIKNMRREIKKLKVKVSHMERDQRIGVYRDKVDRKQSRSGYIDRNDTVNYGSPERLVERNLKNSQNQPKSTIRKQFLKHNQSNKSVSVSSKFSSPNFSLQTSKTTLKRIKKNRQSGNQSKHLLNKKINELKKQAKLDLEQKLTIKKSVENKIKAKSMDKLTSNNANLSKVVVNKIKRQQMMKNKQKSTGFQNNLDHLLSNHSTPRGSPQIIKNIAKQQNQLQPEVLHKQQHELSIQHQINYFNSSQNLRQNLKSSNQQLIDTANFNNSNGNELKTINTYFSKPLISSQSNLLDSEIKIITFRNVENGDGNIKKLENKQVKMQIGVEEIPTYKLFDAFEKQMQENIEYKQEYLLKQKLKQSEFQFDQLVRQQLLSSDYTETQLIKNSIRTVLNTINQLKYKLSL